MPVDYATDAGRVRLLIPDTDEDHQLFGEQQVQAFLALERGVIKRAAAAALEVAASNEAMVSKVIRSQDLSTDGAKVSDALLKRAAELRRQADEDDPDSGGGLDVVDYVDPFTRRFGVHEAAEPEWT